MQNKFEILIREFSEAYILNFDCDKFLMALIYRFISNTMILNDDCFNRN